MAGPRKPPRPQLHRRSVAPAGATAQRLDLWLFLSRFWKTRAIAVAVIAEGGVRLNGRVVDKPAQPVSPGDVLTFVKAGQVRVIRVTGLPTRRGPAAEAATFWQDLDAGGAPAALE